METNVTNEGPKTSVRHKKRFWVVVGAAIILIFLLGVYIAWQVVQLSEGRSQVERFAEELERTEQAIYEMQLADTFGGQTPQETLQMYIDAVEAGDYELASKYFVIGKQEEEKNILLQADENGNIEFFVGVLNQLKSSEGYFSSDKDRYTIENPVFADFILYPSSVWKIAEI